MNINLNHLKINLLHTGYAKLDNNWNYKNVISPFTRMIFVTKGSAKIYHTNQTFNLRAGYMYLIPSYVYNKYNCEIYHEQYYIGFFEEIKYGLSIYDLKDFIYEVKATQYDEEYFKRLLTINPNKAVLNSDPKVSVNATYLSKINVLNDNYYLETKGIISILLSRFIKNTNITAVSKPVEGGLDKIIAYISQVLHTDINVEKLANYSSLNSDYFSKIFKEKYKIRPHKYIQQKRIERAQILLLTTNRPLLEIANEVGFKNAAHFSKVFKKIIHKSPGKYRKAHLNI